MSKKQMKYAFWEIDDRNLIGVFAMCFDDKNTKYNRGICLVGQNRLKLPPQITP